MRAGLSMMRMRSSVGGEARQDLARGVHAHAVGHEDLEPVARPVLGLHRANALLDVGLLVPAGHDDRDERVRRHGTHEYRRCTPRAHVSSPTPEHAVRLASLARRAPRVVQLPARRRRGRAAHRQARQVPAPSRRPPVGAHRRQPERAPARRVAPCATSRAGMEIARARTLEPGYAAKQAAWKCRGERRHAGPLRARSRAMAKQMLFPDPQVLWQPAAQATLLARLAAAARRRAPRQRSALLAVPDGAARPRRGRRRRARLPRRVEHASHELRDDALDRRPRARRSARSGAPPHRARRGHRHRRVSREPARALPVPRPRARLRRSPTATIRTTSRATCPIRRATGSSSRTRAPSSR